MKKGTRLISNVIIEGNTEIGENCTIHPFAGIGLPPQDLKYKDEKTGVKIGNNNIIREYVTIHRASVGGDGITEIGSNNFLMAYVHIAHDCKLGNNIAMANLATLAGHVVVEDYAFIGGIVAIHQFTRIGAYAMVGASAVWDRIYLPIQWRQARGQSCSGLIQSDLRGTIFLIQQSMISRRHTGYCSGRNIR